MKLHPIQKAKLTRPVTMELPSGERIELKISLVEPSITRQDPYGRRGMMAIDTWINGKQYGVHTEYSDNTDTIQGTLERIRTELLETMRQTVVEVVGDQSIRLSQRDSHIRLVVAGSDDHYEVRKSPDFIPVEHYPATTKVMDGEIGTLKRYTIVTTEPGSGEDISDLLAPKQEEKPLIDFDL